MSEGSGGPKRNVGAEGGSSAAPLTGAPDVEPVGARAVAAVTKVGGQPEASGPAEALGWGELVHSTARLFRLSRRIALRRKLLFMWGGVLVYYAILYTVAIVEPGEGFGVEQALLVLLEVPGTILGIYLTMDLVARERDRATLEALFSTASSHYLVWTVRLLCVWAVLLSTLLAMSTIAYFFFAELPLVRGGLNAFLPAFLLSAATFFFAVRVRGANTAGMLGLGVLLLVLMSAEALGDTSWFLFLNPFEPPLGDDFLWAEKVLLNRLGVFAAGALLVFLGLRRMERREKFLG